MPRRARSIILAGAATVGESGGGPQPVGSLAFPGGPSTADSGALSIPRPLAASINVGAAEFTVEHWIRPSATPADNAATVTEGANYSATGGNIIWDADGFSTTRGWIVGLSAGALYLGVNIDGVGEQTEVGLTDLRDGLWHHVAVYRDAATGLMELFVDGAREGSVTGPAGDISHDGSTTTPTDGEHVLGKEKLNLTNGYNGDISEIRVSTNRRYNGATYTVPTAPFTDDAGTVGLYHLAEGSGTTAADGSGDNNTGTLIGNPVPTWSAEDPF